jgi:hypothetical protein
MMRKAKEERIKLGKAKKLCQEAKKLCQAAKELLDLISSVAKSRRGDRLVPTHLRTKLGATKGDASRLMKLKWSKYGRRCMNAVSAKSGARNPELHLQVFVQPSAMDDTLPPSSSCGVYKVGNIGASGRPNGGSLYVSTKPSRLKLREETFGDPSH